MRIKLQQLALIIPFHFFQTRGKQFSLLWFQVKIFQLEVPGFNRLLSSVFWWWQGKEIRERDRIFCSEKRKSCLNVLRMLSIILPKIYTRVHIYTSFNRYYTLMRSILWLFYGWKSRVQRGLRTPRLNYGVNWRSSCDSRRKRGLREVREAKLEVNNNNSGKPLYFLMDKRQINNRTWSRF